MTENRQLSLVVLIIGVSIVLGTFTLSICAQAEAMETDSRGIYLTWPENDVYHTMAASYWTEDYAKSWVWYDTVSRDGIPGKYTNQIKGVTHQISTTRSTWDNWYHDVVLRGLKPGTTYYFIVGSPGNWSKEYSFRTIGIDQQVKFVFGGDSRGPGPSELEGPVFPEARIAVSKAAAAEDPDFIVFGGDLVRQGSKEEQWEAWFDDVTAHFVTKEGRMIPIVPAIGNHDLAGVSGMSDYDYYRGLFVLPNNELWYTLDFPDIRLLALCASYGSGWAEEGMSNGEKTEQEVLQQVDFLQERLQNATQKEVITVQHVDITGGKAFKQVDNSWSMVEHWVPLFKKYGVALNLAGHWHRYVRTWPIKHFELGPESEFWPNGTPIIDLAHNSEKGVTYLVNGAWGAPTEWMEKGSMCRIHDWFAAAYSRPAYTLIEETKKGLHITTKDVRAGWVYDWFGLSHVMDEFTLPYTTEEFPPAEYNIAF